MGFLFRVFVVFTFSSHCIKSPKYLDSYSKSSCIHRLFAYGVFNVRFIKVDCCFCCCFHCSSLSFEKFSFVPHSEICYGFLFYDCLLLVRHSEWKTKLPIWLCQWYIAVCIQIHTINEMNDEQTRHWTQPNSNKYQSDDGQRYYSHMLKWLKRQITTVNQNERERNGAGDGAGRENWQINQGICDERDSITYTNHNGLRQPNFGMHNKEGKE